MDRPRFSRISLLLSLLFWIPLTVTAGEITPAAINTVQDARSLASSGRLDEAVTLLETNRALAAADNNQYYEAMILNSLGLVYETQQRYLEAQKAFEGSINLLTRVRGENAPALLEPLGNESRLLYEARQYSQAEALAHRNLAVRNAMGENDTNTGTELGLLGRIYLAEHKYPEAKKCAEDSLRILDQQGGADAVGAALAYSILGAVYNQYAENTGAQQSLERSLSLLQNSLDPHDYRIGEATANLGFLYANEGANDKAEPLLEKAHGFFRGAELNNIFTREFLASWAQIERKWGHRKKAKELAREAEALAAKSPEATFSRYVVDASDFR